MATSINEFRLKLAPSTFYNFSINWGDGTSEIFNQTTSSSEDLAGLTHTYVSPSAYEVSITENVSGGFSRIYFNGTSNTSLSNDDVKVTDIIQWGNPTWTSMIDAFEGCSNLSAISTDDETSALSGVSNFSNAWNNCTSLTSFPLIDTSKGTIFNSAWNNCNKLKDFPAINTLSATSFESTWANCTSLSSFPLINFTKVTTPYFTWSGCTSLTSFPLIDTSNCTQLGLCRLS